MTLTPIRLAIDVSKRWLDIHDAGCGRTWRIANREPQIAELLATLPPRSTIVLEATAPYDTELRRLASAAGHALNRLNPSRARDFARAAGFLAKTDAIDARMLAHMAATLPAQPEPAYDAAREALAALHRRRDQLVECRAVERGRIADVREHASAKASSAISPGSTARSPASSARSAPPSMRQPSSPARASCAACAASAR